MGFREVPVKARKSRNVSFLCILACALACLTPASGQSPSEWLTSSGDAARDAWQRSGSDITPANAAKIKLLWKLKVANMPRGMQSFREPLIVTGVKTADGSHTLAILAGAANDIYAIDAESGQIVWQTKLKWASDKPEEQGQGEGFICTNAMSATPVVSPIDAAVRRLYELSSDGYLHTVDLSTGAETDPPIQVLPRPYGKPYGLNLVNNVVYTVTGQGCGGNPNVLYAVDLTNKKVTLSSPSQGGIWGTAGAAVGSDGTIYFETGDGPYDAATGKLATTFQSYTFSNDQLTMKDYYTPSNHKWLTRRDLDMNDTPVVFPYKGRDVVVGSGKEGRFFLARQQISGWGRPYVATLSQRAFFEQERQFSDRRYMGKRCQLGSKGRHALGAGADRRRCRGEVSDLLRSHAAWRNHCAQVDRESRKAGTRAGMVVA